MEIQQGHARVPQQLATMSTSYIMSAPTSFSQALDYRNMPPQRGNLSSTGKGILIGMLSAFGSALFVALVLVIVYFFRYTSRGRIFLDRIGRPGEYDDEQQFAREEAEALEEMDDIQRAEYMRAKGSPGSR